MLFQHNNIFKRTKNIKEPCGWHELDDMQLRYPFGMLADDYTSAKIRRLSFWILSFYSLF